MTGAVVGACALDLGGVFGAASTGDVIKHPSGLPRRVLGRTGLEVSVVAFPGLCMVHDDQAACTRAARMAIDKGVNWFDVAPAYGNGTCEERMGVALEGVRDSVFVSCKTKMRDKEGARLELERSFKRLKTDHFDLYQMHHLRSAAEVKQALGPGGAIETFLKAKEEGKVRWLGFSAHTTRAALDALNGFDFHTVMFPINFVEYYRFGFGKAVLELAAKKKAGVFAMKAMSRGSWAQGAQRSRQWWYQPTESQAEIDMAIRWALSQPGVVAAISPSFVDLFEKSIEAGKGYRPITETEIQRLKEIADAALSVFDREDRQHAMLDHPYPYGPYDGCCATA
jgi:predicted aldo/keto reductase-like oxidoreductase